jgi:RNA polymerase sigma-70 factor (ECF subfamily)
LRVLATTRQEQFLRLFLHYQLQVEAYVRSLVPNRADAEELLQDVAAVLWRKFDDFELGTRFDHWACRVAHNHVLNFYRRKSREAAAFGDLVFSAVAEESLQQNNVWAERREALEVCLDQLPQADRELIRLRYQPAATNRTVARQTGRSESAISRALNRIYLALLNCARQRLDSRAERSGG